MTATIALPRQPHSDWLARLRTIMVLRPGQRVVNVPGVGVDVRAGRNTLHAGGGDWWAEWDAAWQARGAASYAASLNDLTGNGYSLTTAVAPAWDNVAGWTGDGATQYLDTGIVPTAATWTFMVRYTDANDGGTPYGTYMFDADWNAMLFWISPVYFGTMYSNGIGGNINPATSLSSGVVAISGNYAYANGIPDGSSNFTYSAPQNARSVYICAAQHPFGGLSRAFSGSVQAMAIKFSVPASRDAWIAARYAEMAAL